MRLNYTPLDYIRHAIFVCCDSHGLRTQRDKLVGSFISTMALAMAASLSA